VPEERAQAKRFAEPFRAVYLTFHRGTGPGASWPAPRGQSWSTWRWRVRSSSVRPRRT